MTIDDVLSRPPDELLSLSESQLQALLAPFIPASRTAILPEEKARKLGVETRMMIDAISANRDELKAMLAAREKEGL